MHALQPSYNVEMKQRARDLAAKRATAQVGTNMTRAVRQMPTNNSARQVHPAAVRFVLSIQTHISCTLQGLAPNRQTLLRTNSGTAARPGAVAGSRKQQHWPGVENAATRPPPKRQRCAVGRRVNAAGFLFLPLQTCHSQGVARCIMDH